MNAGWMAVWTRSHHEKAVRDHLLGLRVEVFLPLITLRSRRRDRRLTVELPAFPGYLFARLPASDAHVVRWVRGVVSILGPRPGEYSVVPEGEIEAVRRVVESELRVDPFPYLQAGRRVRVKAGPLRGLEGTLVRKRSGLRLVIEVRLLSQAIAAEVGAEDVEAV